MVLATFISAATQSEDVGFWSAVAIGGAKEMWDIKQPNHVASFKDFAWGLSGAYLGAKHSGWAVSKNNGIAVLSYTLRY